MPQKVTGLQRGADGIHDTKDCCVCDTQHRLLDFLLPIFFLGV